jgi:quinol monooxygenase YgiN
VPESMPEITDGELFMSNTLVVRSESRADYLDQLREVLPQARALPGCLLLEVGERVDAPATFILTERWRNGREYLHEYLALPFYRSYLAATEDMYAAPRTVAVLSSITTTG